MPDESFVHLHNHSQFSLLDGAQRIEEMVEQAVAFKMPAVAITDHGNLFGAIRFVEKCKEKGIKPGAAPPKPGAAAPAAAKPKGK